ncbi:hypothetical protein V500_03542 [Pseudogymnoascus sp. VKM F-4518 (FW-2643)]|nr:hypothetical protein V500_03542 [Pseudogymnoascus sp. VKM F-4518 (FW-2643)]
MLSPSVVVALLASAGLIEGAAIDFSRTKAELGTNLVLRQTEPTCLNLHLKAGFFVNPTTNYYTALQDLDDNGDVIGHCHITVQDIGELKSTTPPDPTKFAFFKGIDDAGNGQGHLQAVVEGGLLAGVYRAYTMIAARNHQPVNMPVA